MEEFLSYFLPINITEYSVSALQNNPELFYNKIYIFQENEKFNIKDFNIALIGVSETRNSINEHDYNSPKKVRQQLYNLTAPYLTQNIVDLGNFKLGKKVSDTYFGLSFILEELIKNNILPIIIGGSQDLTYANFTAYDKLERLINITTIDSQIDISLSNEIFNSKTYINKIIEHKANTLFNYNNIGHQTCFTPISHIELLKKLNFNSHRLGEFQNNIQAIEPVIRDTDILSFDINSIKQSDAPGANSPSPNGLTAFEACQIAHYAGMSNKITSFGIYEYSPENDIREQTANLIAQIIWHFIRAFYSRMPDFPTINIEECTQFIVKLEDNNKEIVFYKSPFLGSWWFEIPTGGKNPTRLIIACSYEDYKKASNNEIPDIWWRTVNKIKSIY